jgi:hypothetical protein
LGRPVDRTHSRDTVRHFTFTSSSHRDSFLLGHTSLICLLIFLSGFFFVTFFCAGLVSFLVVLVSSFMQLSTVYSCTSLDSKSLDYPIKEWLNRPSIDIVATGDGLVQYRNGLFKMVDPTVGHQWRCTPSGVFLYFAGVSILDGP